jgi:hypothetical protein
MWVDKDDIFAEDKVREFKDSNPEAETHIRVSSAAKSPYPSALIHSHLLYQHASKYMSSDGNDELAFEYPAGATADSPIPFSQTNPIDTPISVPVPIVDFTTLQPLNTVASPRPVTASSSASDVAAMFRQLRVHTPAPLTTDRQRAASQANETFTVSFTPAEGRRSQAGSSLESGTAVGSEEALGAATATTGRQRSHSHDSATNDVTDLQGPPSERTPEEKLWDFKTRAQQYARDRESCDDVRISYLEFLETEAEEDLALARMIAG